MLALALLFAVLLQAPTRPIVDALIEHADLVVLARVVATPVIEGSELAELAVERVLYGPGTKRAFALSRDARVRAPKSGPDPEQSYLLFLQASSVADGARKGSERLWEEKLQGAPLYCFEGNACWKLTDAEHVLAPSGALPLENGPPSREIQASGELVPRDALADWLVQRIERSMPSIRVTVCTTGSDPVPVCFLIGPDGSVQGRGASTAHIEPARLQELWALLASERFAELPERVGSSYGPDGAILVIELRQPGVRKVVNIMGDYLARLTPAERDAAERALRIWKALPLASTR